MAAASGLRPLDCVVAVVPDVLLVEEVLLVDEELLVEEVLLVDDELLVDEVLLVDEELPVEDVLPVLAPPVKTLIGEVPELLEDVLVAVS